jgi:hypothetical protein
MMASPSMISSLPPAKKLILDVGEGHHIMWCERNMEVVVKSESDNPSAFDFGLESIVHRIVGWSSRSPPSLGQKTNVRYDVLHFSVGESAAPRMHRTENDAVLDGPQ